MGELCVWVLRCICLVRIFCNIHLRSRDISHEYMTTVLLDNYVFENSYGAPADGATRMTTSKDDHEIQPAIVRTSSVLFLVDRAVLLSCVHDLRFCSCDSVLVSLPATSTSFSIRQELVRAY